MSNESEDHSTRDESGSDCGSPVESGEDGRVSSRSRKCPTGSQWTFSATFTVETQTFLSSDEVASNLAELFQHVFLEQEGAKQYLGHGFVKFI